MIFIYIYDALMVPNAAWSNFLIDGLDFSDWMIGLVTIAGATFAWLGTSFYTSDIDIDVDVSASSSMGWTLVTG
jgi:hypothetical protein